MNRSPAKKPRHFSSGTRWLLGALVVLVAVVPSFFLAALELRTQRRLVNEVEQGLYSEAVQLSDGLARISERILYEENIAKALDETGYVVRDASSPTGAYYDAPFDQPTPGLIDYPFFIDLADSTLYPGRSATHPDELLRALPLATLANRVENGRPLRGVAEGPYGPFHYVYRFQNAGIDNRLVVHGAKINAQEVLRQVIPRAYRLLREEQAEQREVGHVPEEHLGFEVVTPDTTIVLSDIRSRWGRDEAAIGAYQRPLELGGLFPGWEIHVQYFNALKADRWRSYFSSLVPLIIVIIGMFVTARVTMREMELSRLKSVFVSNVSHELKTPIAKIRLFNELLEGQPPEASEKRDRYHAVIERECERLALLVDNVLDFNRIERGQMKYDFREVPVDEVVAEVVDTFSVIYEERGYRVDLEMDEHLPAILMDPDTIKQALINLLDNAVKYSEPHTLVVRAVRARLEGRSAVAMSVKDQGIGIPRESLEHIFDEFYRVNGDQGKPVSGSGLGLALVRHIVEAHGGRIQVSSRVGAGSTFTILLPLSGVAPQKRKTP